jgi:hypothetical protein
MLINRRGYSAPYAAFKTPLSERGMWHYVASMSPGPGDLALTYDEWARRLAVAGVNTLRIKLNGENILWDYGAGKFAMGFEPPPYGTFNLWSLAVDPVDMSSYHLAQWPGDTPLDPWKDSNLVKLVDACDKYDIGLHVIPFQSIEFTKQWHYNSWNENCHYANGEPCEESDRGFLQSEADCFETSRGRNAAKRRIDAIVNIAGSVISSWEIMGEMTWLATSVPRIWGVEAWSPEHFVIIREVLVPWVEEMALYIKSRMPNTKVGNGQIWWAGLSEFSSNPFHLTNVINELYQTPSLDFAMMNAYGSEDLHRARHWLQECQEKIGKQIVVEQYAPWEINRDLPWTEDPEPYVMSKEAEFLFACGGPGLNGPFRWPGIEEFSRTKNWVRGSYADPGMMSIAGVTYEIGDTASYDAMSGLLSEPGENWDANISSPELDLVSSWGNGKYVQAFCKWRGGPATRSILIAGLDPDTRYGMILFSIDDGYPCASRIPDINVGGVAEVSVLVEGTSIAFYIYSDFTTPDSEIPSPSNFKFSILSEGSEAFSARLSEGVEYTFKLTKEE